MNDREEAIDILTRMSTDHFYGHRTMEAFRLGAEALSAERRGRWIETLFSWRCSVCGEEQDYSVYFKHCPNCGARMKKQHEE